MTRAYPFRRPTPGVIRPDIWSVAVPEGTVPLADVLPEWDYNTVLHLQRTVVVDGRTARREVGLPADAPLTLSVRWTASGSLLRGLGCRFDVRDADGVEIELAFGLPGAELGGTLTLDTMVSTGAATRNGAERSPTRPGSVLWGDTYDVRLQGDAPLFPVAVADFADLAYPEAAAWYLEIDRDFDAAAMGSMLLLVNTRSELLVRALSEAGAPGPDAAAVLSTLRSDIARTLVEHALSDDEFGPTNNYETSTLGATLAGLASQLGIDDWESLRREHRSEPALFASRLQAATKLWQGLR